MTAPGPDPTITCFGELQIELSGRVVTPDLPGRKGRALVAYLILKAPRPVARDELLEVLWPSSPPAKPDAALRSIVAKVRRVLGPGLVAGRESLTLRLPAGARVDVQEVKRAVEHAERAFSEGHAAGALDAAADALEVLARPLLPSLSGDWVEAARVEFGDARLRALEVAARAGLAIGGNQLAPAERAAAELVEAEPFREDGYALLMEAQARRGNAAEALRTFEQLRVLLRDELGATPSPRVVAMHENVLRGELPSAGPGTQEGGATAGFPVPAVAPRTNEGAFVGRAAYLDQLRSCWADSRAGRTRLVLLVAEPGIGKTRLATRLADEVQREGGAVLYGRADAEALLPYQPFAEALHHLVAHAGQDFLAAVQRELAILSRPFPDLGPPVSTVAVPVDQDALRYQVFEAVVSLLTRAGAIWPLLLVLDDLHWADKPTLLLLRHVLRRAEGTRLLVVATSRQIDMRGDHPLADLLGDLRRERRYDRLNLTGLDEDATRELVVDRLGTPVTPAFSRRLREQTEGNAFFIEETARALEDAGVSREAVLDADALDGLGIPEGVEEVILRRVRQLSPLASELLTTASVVGRSFALGIVEQVVDASPDQMVEAVEESLAAGLVLECTDAVGLTFSHALVREVLYERRLSAVGRERLHFRVGLALERLSGHEPVNPAELAHHFRLARRLAGPEPGRRYSIAAGQQAAQLFAYEEATSHYRLALELFENEDERGRCEALLALGRVQWHAGDDDARNTFMEAVRSAERRGAADQLSRAALGLGERYFEVTYLGERYRDLLEKAAAALGPDDSPQLALLRSRLAVNLGFPNESDRALRLAADAVAMARRLEDEELLTAVLLARHVTLLDVRHIDQRLALSEELRSLAGSHAELAAELHHWRLYDLLGVGAVEDARTELDSLEELALQLGQPLFRALAEGARGLWAELDGDVERSERCADESLRQARLAHTQDAVSSWASQLYALRRRQRRVGELAPFVERLAGSGGHQLGWLSALGVLRFETGDVDDARRIYEEELKDGPGGLPRGMFWLTRVALLSELCAKLGDVARAEALYEELAPHASRNVVVAYCSFWGPVDGYLALLAETAGDTALAARHAQAALERTRAIDAPLLTRELEQRHGELIATA
jgi:DNA-binding SARP family transcriptional activator/KaiC/GvpD/RAD55 family RecA-like ATPase